MNQFATAALLFAVPLIAQQPIELKTEGDNISLKIDEDGVAMTDFVKLAERLTGRVFMYSKKEIAGIEPVKLVGQLKMKKAAFLPFFKTMLFTKGFVTRARSKGDVEIIEIVSTKGLKQRNSRAARYVAAADLEAHKTGISMILTSIPLAHIKPKLAADRVRQALAVTANKAILGNAGQANSALLVQGTGADVYCVERMLRLIDVPPRVGFEVVALEHVVAAELAPRMKKLFADRSPAVVVIAHASANALMLSGPPEFVKKAVEVVELLDRAAGK